jgi:hypothetical protein
VNLHRFAIRFRGVQILWRFECLKVNRGHPLAQQRTCVDGAARIAFFDSPAQRRLAIGLQRINELASGYGLAIAPSRRREITGEKSPERNQWLGSTKHEK